MSDFYELNVELHPDPNVYLSYVDENTAVLVGYMYHFKEEWGIFGQSVQVWKPFQQGTSAGFAYSLHLHDPEASGIENNVITDGTFKLWPNPSGNVNWLEFIAKGHVQIDLYDLTGRFLKSVYNGSSDGNLRVTSDIGNLTPGIYTYLIKTGEGIKPIKFIKQ